MILALSIVYGIIAAGAAWGAILLMRPPHTITVRAVLLAGAWGAAWLPLMLWSAGTAWADWYHPRIKP